MAPRRRRPARPGALADLAPLRILTQILLLQVGFYSSAMVLIIFSSLTAGQHPDAGLLLDWHNLRGDITDGWMLGLCWVLTAPISAVMFMVLIARSKLVPDFALTTLLIDLIVTSLYTKAVPRNLFWWLVRASSAAIMIALGIWSCRYRELQPMAFGGSAPATTKSSDAAGDYELAPVEE
jgi:hypothetical protein